ncbi:MAG: hypothetical protein V4654_02565 [Bdellovibrionota bacterium]
MKENTNNQDQNANQRRDEDRANKAGQTPSVDKSSGGTSQPSRDSQYGERQSGGGQSQTQRTNK